MATREAVAQETTPRDTEHRDAVRYVAAGSASEAIGGAGAVALAILGLVGVLPMTFAAIGTMAAGAALMLRGGASVAELEQLRAELGATNVVTGGVSTELVGGVAGLALGVLALVGVAPFTLMAAAAITFGGTLLIGSGLTARVNELAVRHSGASEGARAVARESVKGAAGAQVLVGLGAAALGILALTGVDTLSFILIAVLAVGGSELLTGSALGSQMAAAMS